MDHAVSSADVDMLDSRGIEQPFTGSRSMGDRFAVHGHEMESAVVFSRCLRYIKGGLDIRSAQDDQGPGPHR